VGTPTVDDVLGVTAKIEKAKRRAKAAAARPVPIVESVTMDDETVYASFGFHLKPVSNDHGAMKSKWRTSRQQNLAIVRALGVKFGWPRVMLQHFPKELAIAAGAAAARKHDFTPPLNVDIVRIAPRLVDPRNLDDAAKHVIDAISRWIGVDDGNEAAVRYSVRQRQQTKTVGVIFTIRSRV
jgi:hypothetical protein